MKILFIILFIVLSISIFPQNIEKIITPDDSTNSFLNNIDINSFNNIRFEETNDGLILDFRLPSNWIYTAGKNLSTKYGRIDFAFYNGVLYTNSKNIKYVSFRSRVYPQLFTDKIKSNVFAIGFQKDDQATIFIATNESINAIIDVDKSIVGRQLHFEIPLTKNESKLIRITNKFPPYFP